MYCHSSKENNKTKTTKTLRKISYNVFEKCMVGFFKEKRNKIHV